MKIKGNYEGFEFDFEGEPEEFKDIIKELKPKEDEIRYIINPPLTPEDTGWEPNDYRYYEVTCCNL